MTTMAGTVNLGRHEDVRALSGESARANVTKNILLFFAAPFIGLVYIVALPFVGTVAILRLALRALI